MKIKVKGYEVDIRSDNEFDAKDFINYLCCLLWDTSELDRRKASEYSDALDFETADIYEKCAKYDSEEALNLHNQLKETGYYGQN